MNCQIRLIKIVGTNVVGKNKLAGFSKIAKKILTSILVTVVEDLPPLSQQIKIYHWWN
jgi:hypothetical protein